MAFLSLPKELRFFLQKKKRPHVYPCVQMVGEDEESMLSSPDSSAGITVRSK